jgi:hypothetical protein
MFENSILIGVAVAISASSTLAASGAPGFTPGNLRRSAEAEGAVLQVAVFQDPSPGGAVNLSIEVTNTSAQGRLLPGGDFRNGLEFYFTTADGRTILDRSTQPVGDYFLAPGKAMTRHIDLARRPLYLPSQGFLQRVVELDGIYDEALSGESYLWLHVTQQGDGQELAIEPIQVFLSVPRQLRQRGNFLKLFGEEGLVD